VDFEVAAEPCDVDGGFGIYSIGNVRVFLTNIRIGKSSRMNDSSGFYIYEELFKVIEFRQIDLNKRCTWNTDRM